jgi:hypothetical protein
MSMEWNHPDISRSGVFAVHEMIQHKSNIGLIRAFSHLFIKLALQLYEGICC